MKSITQVMKNLVKPYIDTKDKAYAANIAPVEVSPAEAAHTAGTQLIYNGVLYDVTADIAIGDTVTTEGAGANISAASKVTEQISSVNEALSNEVSARAELGAHNLFGYTETLQNGSGIVYQFNSDGTIDISGTPTALSYILFKNIKLPKAKFILSGAENIVNMQWDTVVLYKNGSVVHNFAINSKTATEFDASSYDFDNAEVSLKRISNNVAVSGKLYPMIRLASDTDTTYQPYAMTNRELTDNVVVKNVTITPKTGVTISYNGSYKIGNLAILNFVFLLDASFSVANDAPIVTIDTPPLDNAILVPAAMLWDGEVGGLLGIMKTNNIIKLATSSHFVAGKSYAVNATYVCA